MRILLTGSQGQVGWELQRTLAPQGEVIACDRSQLDLADANRIAEVVRAARPNIIVNAAAYTAVDKAESEPGLAHTVNARAPALLAEEAKKLGALLVHYTTDYVFDGSKSGPYTEDDTPNPLGVYGRTKLEGERAIQSAGCRHLILRTSWVYGPRGKNFLLTMLRLAKERDELRVVDDQVGAPTTAAMIAEATSIILSARAEADGLYHMSASGHVSWCGFARAILRGAGLNTRVTAIPSSEYPTPAKRPVNSVLDNAKLQRELGLRLPEWENGLAASLAILERDPV